MSQTHSTTKNLNTNNLFFNIYNCIKGYTTENIHEKQFLNNINRLLHTWSLYYNNFNRNDGRTSNKTILALNYHHRP